MRRDIDEPSSPPETSRPRSSEVRVHALAGDPKLRVFALPAQPTAVPELLTAAEADVAARIVRGQSRRAIAEARSVSMHTVDTQIRALLEKLGVDSGSELVAVLAVDTP